MKNARNGSTGSSDSYKDALKPLTSLRFVAASLVVLYHCPPTAPFAAAYTFGHIGVGFFFVLSGFILTLNYYHVFADGLARSDVRRFFIARAARIYPVYAFATVCALLALWYFHGPYWSSSSAAIRCAALIAQLAMVQSWIPIENVYFGINSPAWSVSTEAFFYVVFPVLAFTSIRLFRASQSGRILFAAAALWVTICAVNLYPHRIFVWIVYVLPSTRLIDFVVGVFVGIAFIKRNATRTHRRLSTLTEMLVVAAAIGSVGFSRIVPEALRYALFMIPISASLIWVFAHQTGNLSRMLSHPVCVRLGEISFAVYMIHWIVFQVMGSLIGWRDPYAQVPLSIGVLLALSFALYACYEEPMRRMVRTQANRMDTSDAWRGGVGLGTLPAEP